LETRTKRIPGVKGHSTSFIGSSQRLSIGAVKTPFVGSWFHFPIICGNSRGKLWTYRNETFRRAMDIHPPTIDYSIAKFFAFKVISGPPAGSTPLLETGKALSMHPTR